MRFKINIELIKGNSFPVNWRSKILRILKKGLKQCDLDIFEDFFGTAKQKNYTWAVYFQNVKFEKNEIRFLGDEKKATINFSAYDNVDSLNIYNAFSSLRFKEIEISEETKVVVTNISILPRKIIEDNVLIVKTMSPIVCRDHNQETKKDTYYIGTDNKFTEIIKRNLYTRLKELKGEYVKKDIEDLIIDSSQTKKIVVKHYDKTKKDKTLNYENKFNGKFLDTSVGILKLEGKSYILDYIYNAGLGSITGSGFGMLEKLK